MAPRIRAPTRGRGSHGPVVQSCTERGRVDRRPRARSRQWAAAPLVEPRRAAHLAGVGSRVRTPDPDRLSAALEAAGHAYRHTEEGLAVDAAPEQVGEFAAAHGIVLHALTETGGLEQAFFQLIEKSAPAKGSVSAEGELS